MCNLVNRSIEALFQCHRCETVTASVKIFLKFISRKTDYPTGNYGLPVTFIGCIWWPCNHLWTALYLYRQNQGLSHIGSRVEWTNVDLSSYGRVAFIWEKWTCSVLTIQYMKHFELIEAETKWMPFRRRHIPGHFLDCECLIQTFTIKTLNIHNQTLNKVQWQW